MAGPFEYWKEHFSIIMLEQSLSFIPPGLVFLPYPSQVSNIFNDAIVTKVEMYSSSSFTIHSRIVVSNY